MHVVLIGATGLIGSNLLEALLQDIPTSKVTIISRRKLDFKSDKLTQIIVPEFSKENINSLKITADVFICALGTTIKVAGSKEKFKEVDYEFVLAFSELAQNAKALFIVSALGANPKSKIFYNRIKGEMESAVSKLNIPSIYFLHPSLLIGERKDKRFAEEVGIKVYNILSPLLPTKLSQKMGTHISDIVRYLLFQIHKIEAGIHPVDNFKVIGKTLGEKLYRLNLEDTNLLPYNEKSFEIFELEKKNLMSLFGENIIKRVEHFGSTAIKNIPAKPIIDILVEVNSLEEVKEKVVPVLEGLGYDYIWRPTINYDGPWYAWFIKRDNEGKRTHHIHMVEKDFEIWERLLFRDYLNEFSDKAQEYAKLKKELSEKYPNDRSKYTVGKTQLVQKYTAEAKEYYQ